MNKKTLIVYLSLLLFLAIFSCQDDEDTSIPWFWARHYWGEISISRNADDLDLLIVGLDHAEMNPDKVVRPGIGFAIDEYSNTERIGALGFMQLPCETGHYPIETNEEHSSFEPSVFYATLEESDALGDIYNTDNDKSNFISIDSITDDMQIFGHFELFMVRDTSRAIVLPFLPDTFHFECDYFQTRLMEPY